MSDEMPQGDSELPRHRDDPHLVAPRAILGEARAIPRGKFARGLVAHPRPGNLDKLRPCRLVPGFTDALIPLDLAARIWSWGQA